jgi:succinate dehydrogenase / fumarate reductase, cytochrome b subunit
MSKSVLIKSSLAKKYWMALTGLFLCLFLVGHLLGNLQLFMTDAVGKLKFNEYALFMTTNPAVKILSYVTYISILFHAIDGILLAVANKKARPVGYAMSQPGANSSFASRNMALLGTVILVFIATHMVNFWAKMHFSEMPLQKIEIQTSPEETKEFYITTTGSYLPVDEKVVEVRNGREFFDPTYSIKKIGEGYKDLHQIVMDFFNPAVNDMALLATLLYVIAMAAMSFHLMHGFQSAFQSLGVRHKKFTPLIKNVGYAFAILVPVAFAAIPVYLFVTQQS